MSNEELTHTLTQAVAELSEASALKELFHRHKDGNPLPSGQVLEEIVQLLRTILFPGYYGQSSVNTRSIEYHIGVHIERLHQLLSDQILAGLCFAHCDEDDTAPQLEERRSEAERMAAELEIISCYPVIKALVNYRVAHELLKMGVPLIPRILTEMAHSETGIDIHPAASIGEYFTIDHGTGVVVGATCIIGRNVKLYQGVTLGARSFPLDEDGHPIRDILRHPVLEDNVIVYSNATILGRVTIGEGCVVGANIWVTEDMAPNTKIYKKTK